MVTGMWRCGCGRVGRVGECIGRQGVIAGWVLGLCLAQLACVADATQAPEQRDAPRLVVWSDTDRADLEQAAAEWNACGVVPVLVQDSPDAMRVTVQAAPPCGNGERVGCFVDGQIYADAQFGDPLRRQIFAHEIGHALGLIAHSDSVHSVMWPVPQAQVSVSVDDCARLAQKWTR